MRGFTTVRDAAGADFGLQEAVAKGLFEGPRLFIAGFPVSQTGGHADMRPKGVRNREMFCTCAGLGLIGAIADGVGEVRRAVREQVRNGANQIKIMAGGGISQPERPARRHAVLARGVARGLRGGRSRQPVCDGARVFAARRDACGAGRRALDRTRQPDRRGHRARDEGRRRVPGADAVDLRRAGRRRRAPGLVGRDAGQAGHRAARAASSRCSWPSAEGVPVVFGTDLLGHMHDRQSGEFDLRAPAMSPVQMLQSATFTAAQLLREEGRSGRAGRRRLGRCAAGRWRPDARAVDADEARRRHSRHRAGRADGEERCLPDRKGRHKRHRGSGPVRWCCPEGSRRPLGGGTSMR